MLCCTSGSRILPTETLKYETLLSIFLVIDQKPFSKSIQTDIEAMSVQNSTCQLFSMQTFSTLYLKLIYLFYCLYICQAVFFFYFLLSIENFLFDFYLSHTQPTTNYFEGGTAKLAMTPPTTLKNIIIHF